MTMMDQYPASSVDEAPATRPDQSREAGGLSLRKPEVNVAKVERALSIAIGAVVIAKGLSRLSIPALLIAGAGAALLNRGVTGHCSVYSRMGLKS